ncbi:hypothetical protein [Actinoplanes sp. TFC3]|uniref:hypothetical protein n=1 Tax=Actinoplanes sp. TFC3 TaxID=1710355 RepID=UPI000833720B|nr:hypothetical protein [Actinoplanes sp. TFC3]
MVSPGHLGLAYAEVTDVVTKLDDIRLLPGEWPAVEAVLKASGRQELPATDRSLLGSLADRFPLIG